MSSSPPGYYEIAPPADLADEVECCWVSRRRVPAGSAPAVSLVLPDGCMDLLVILGGFPKALGDRNDEERARVVGTMTRAQRFRFQGAVDLIALRFRPGGLVPFVSVPPLELVDLGAPLADFWGAVGRELAGRLHGLPSDEARAGLFFELLRERRGRPGDPVARAAARRIGESGGRIAIDELRKVLLVSERTLERRVRAAVGLTPKGLARVARLREASGRLLAEQERSISEIAHACGYYDQSHLNRDFQALAGLTPGEWRAVRTGSERAAALEQAGAPD